MTMRARIAAIARACAVALAVLAAALGLYLARALGSARAKSTGRCAQRAQRWRCRLAAGPTRPAAARRRRCWWRPRRAAPAGPPGGSATAARVPAPLPVGVPTASPPASSRRRFGAALGLRAVHLARRRGRGARAARALARAIAPSAADRAIAARGSGELAERPDGAGDAPARPHAGHRARAARCWSRGRSPR